MNSISIFRLAQFTVIGLILVILPLAPINFLPRAFPMPDLFICYIIAWHLRDPHSAPLPIIIILTLLVDTVDFRPIGLWPLLMIVLHSIITVNRRLFFNSSFFKELVFFSSIFFCALMLELLFFKITFSPSASFSELTQEVIITSICYPLVVAFLHFFCKLKYRYSRLSFSEKL